MTHANKTLWTALGVGLFLVALFGSIGIYLGSLGMDIHLTRLGKLSLDIVSLVIVIGGVALFLKGRHRE